MKKNLTVALIFLAGLMFLGANQVSAIDLYDSKWCIDFGMIYGTRDLAPAKQNQMFITGLGWRSSMFSRIFVDGRIDFLIYDNPHHDLPYVAPVLEARVGFYLMPSLYVSVGRGVSLSYGYIEEDEKVNPNKYRSFAFFSGNIGLVILRETLTFEFGFKGSNTIYGAFIVFL